MDERVHASHFGPMDGWMHGWVRGGGTLGSCGGLPEKPLGAIEQDARGAEVHLRWLGSERVSMFSRLVDLGHLLVVV